jgi:hypothetical protein
MERNLRVILSKRRQITNELNCIITADEFKFDESSKAPNTPRNSHKVEFNTQNSLRSYCVLPWPMTERNLRTVADSSSDS